MSRSDLSSHLPSASLDAMERVLFVACFLFAAWNVWHIATAPLLTIVRHLPDDTFYYLEISRNLGLLGRSSFDAGQTVTTGYHPLWAWICVFLGRLVRYQRMGMLRAMIAVSGALSLGMAAVAGGLAWRHARTTLPIITLLLTSFSYLNNSVGAMEWCVATVISTATLWLLIRAPCVGNGPAAAGLAMLGILGSLARSDFGGQAVGYLAASVLVWRLCRDRRYIVPSSILLMGSSAGLGIAMWYDHSISGSWLKGSAHMKQLWGVAWGISPLPFLMVLVRTIFYFPGLHRSIMTNFAHASSIHGSRWAQFLMLMVLASLVVLVFRCRSLLRFTLRSDGSTLSVSRLFFGASGVFILLLYGAVYSFDSFGMQPWYSANITVAAGALLSLLMKGATKKGRGREARATFAMMTVANVALFVWSKPFADDQAKIIERAVSAKAAFGSASIGVSDAGIFNFVYGGRVINLDGLANDEIIRYAPDRLACYLADKRIEYLNGFGASASAFSLRPLTDYATPFRVSSSRGVEEEFFHVDPNRVRALTECAQ